MFDINKENKNYDYPKPKIETTYNPAPTYSIFSKLDEINSFSFLDYFPSSVFENIIINSIFELVEIIFSLQSTPSNM